MTASLRSSDSSSPQSSKVGSTMTAQFVPSSTVFDFVDELPGHVRGNTPKYLAFADALRENPGRWAVFPVASKSPAHASSRASNLKHGRVSGFTEGEFDAVVRNGTVYVRFTGGRA